MSTVVFNVEGHGDYLYNSQTNIIKKISNSSTYIVKNNESEIIWHDSYAYLLEKQKHCLNSLMLQITRDCNLCCDYCVYSGNFPGMLPHKAEDMSYETICKSIDFFMAHSDQSPEIIILFYGGEPLLKFPNICKAVLYADRFKRNVRYGISSNGVALNEEILVWLRQNPKVYLTITVNGEKHDKYRKTISGKGSLEIIMKNLSFARDNFPDVWNEQIRFIANISDINELLGLRDFYSKSVGKPPIMISKIKFSSKLNAEILRRVNQQIIIESDRRSIRTEYLSNNDPFFDTFFAEKIDRIYKRGICDSHHPCYINSCMPMSWRIFVRTDGTFNMCEKVNDSLDLGNIYDGFNYNTIKKLYYGMQDFAQQNCRNCWAQRLCMFCYQDIVDDNGEIINAFNEQRCEQMRKDIIEYLKLYVEMAIDYPQKLQKL